MSACGVADPRRAALAALLLAVPLHGALAQRPTPETAPVPSGRAEAEIWCFGPVGVTDRHRVGGCSWMIHQAAERPSVVARAFLNRGRARLATRDLDRAFIDLSDAIWLDPGLAAAHAARAAVRFNRRDRNGAMADLDEALRLDPADTRALNLRGVLRMLRSEHEEAVADFDALLRISPANVANIHNRGAARLRQGRLDEAIADFSAALLLRPNLTRSLLYRCIARLRRGDAGAEEDCAAADRVADPADPWPFIVRAGLALMAGDADAAARAAAEAQSRDSRDAYASTFAYAAARRQGRPVSNGDRRRAMMFEPRIEVMITELFGQSLAD